MYGRWSMLRDVALLALLLMMTGMQITAPRALAAGMMSGTANIADTVTLSMHNGTTFSYGGSTPQFAATVVLGAKLPGNYVMELSVLINGAQDNIGGIPQSQSSDGLTYYYLLDSSWSSFKTGTYSAVAVFTNPATGVTTDSNTVTLTINKGTPSLQCMMMNWNQVISPGYALTFQMLPQSNPSTPVDWQNATYTVKFVGPTTVTRSNLVPNNNDYVTAQAPAQTGRYSEVDCIFNGTTLFTPATTNAVGQPVLVSQEKSLGGVQLYTNPTTLVSNRPADMYVVFHAGSGGPTPTGYFNIDFGTNYSNSLTIGADGTLLVHVDQLPNLNGVSQVTIAYHGDPYYNQAVINFPLTNPPIPGNGGGGGGGSGGSGGTPTHTPATTPTSSPTGIANGGSTVPTPTAAPEKPLLASTSGTNTGTLWWLVLLILVILGGAGGGAVVAVRRGKASTRAAVWAPDRASAPGAPAATTEDMAPPSIQETEH